MIFVTFSGVSPTLAAKLGEYRRQLFMGSPVTREQPRKWKILHQQTSPVPKALHKTQLTITWPLLVKPSTMTCGRSNRRQPPDAIRQGSTIAATRTAGNWRRAYPAHPGDPHHTERSGCEPTASGTTSRGAREPEFPLGAAEAPGRDQIPGACFSRPPAGLALTCRTVLHLYPANRDAGEGRCGASVDR